MFLPNRRIAVTGGKITTRPSSSAASRRHGKAETAMLPFTFDTGAGSAMNSVRMSSSGPMAFNYTLTGIVPEYEDMLRRFYRDIYYYDAVAGSAVDIMSAFPFSDFSLTGGTVEQLKPFEESLFRMNVRALFPEMSAIHLVDSAFLGTLVFNDRDKVFTDAVIHNMDRAKIEHVPFYSADPKVTVLRDETTSRFLADTSTYMEHLKAGFSASFLEALRSEAYELNPLTTLWFPRRAINDPRAPTVSWLKRILPIYLLEKQLYRGTLVEAYKRQRSMFHVTVGDDNWEPTPEELDALTALFQQAEIDPLGAVIVTKNGVQGQELRQGGDFWKWTDAADGLVSYKLRALGLSEALLSADATYSNADTGYSVFLENCDAYRANLVYRTITNKVFPVIAHTNGFYRDEKSRPESKALTKQMYALNNQRDLLIPKIQWHKQLEARKDMDPMDLLEKLSEKGVPVPLRQWIAASKIDLDTLLHDLATNDELEKMFAKYRPAEGAPGTDGGESGEDISEEEFASFHSVSNHLPKVPILSRDFGESGEIVDRTRTGKPKYVISQLAAQKKANEAIAKTHARMRDPNYRKAVRDRIIAKFGGMPVIGRGL